MPVRTKGGHGTGSIPRRTPQLVLLAQVPEGGALPEEGGRIAGAAEERVDGETGQKEDEKAPDITAPKTEQVLFSTLWTCVPLARGPRLLLKPVEKW